MDEVRNRITGNIAGTVIQAGEVRLPEMPVAAALAGLPADEGFTGRSNDLAVLASVLAPTADPPGSAVIGAIAGWPGVGKTALVVHAARQAVTAGWFPGGVLFVDLHGYDPAGPLDAGAALAGLLRSLGVPNERIPPDQGERETLYRSRLAAVAQEERRVLVLADNAADRDVVLALRPADASHRMLVTSRHTLPVPGARRIELDILSETDAVAVLAHALDAACPGDPRITAAPAAAAALAGLCGHLPLALRIAAELLADQPQKLVADWVTVFTAARDRLDELAYGDTVGVEVAFHASYQHLPVEQARVFRLLALHPGSCITLAAVSAVTDLPETAARRRTDGLRRAHLIQPTPEGDGYGFHDLLRMYAMRRCQAEHTADERHAAVGRLLDYYRDTVAAASTHLDPSVPPDERSPRFPDRTAALTWLMSERPNLTAICALATNTGRDGHARVIGLSLLYYFDLRKHWDEWIATAEHALAAAQRMDDRDGECDALTSLGIAARQLRRFPAAMDYFAQAIALRHDGRVLSYLGTVLADLRRYDQALDTEVAALATCQHAGDRYGEAMVRGNLGNVCRIMRRWPDALDHYQEAYHISREIGDRYGEGIIMNNLGLTYRSMRRWPEAVEHYHEALVIRDEVGDRYGQGMTLTNLGSVYQRLKRFDDALDCHRQALAIRREVGDRYGEGVTLSNLGTTYRHLRRWEQAVDSYQRALPIRRETNDPYGAGVTLTRLEPVSMA